MSDHNGNAMIPGIAVLMYKSTTPQCYIAVIFSFSHLAASYAHAMHVAWVWRAAAAC